MWTLSIVPYALRRVCGCRRTRRTSPSHDRQDAWRRGVRVDQRVRAARAAQHVYPHEHVASYVRRVQATYAALFHTAAECDPARG